MSSLRRTRIGLLLSTLLFLAGPPFSCLRAKGGQAARLNSPQITVSKYDYTLTERKLGHSARIAESAYQRTEYFASDSRERIEDIDSRGKMRPVKILLPNTQTVISLDFEQKTYTEKHQQVGAVSGVVNLYGPDPPPIYQWTTRSLGTKRIGGLDCDGNSVTKDGAYNEIWICKGAPLDFAVTIYRATDGTGLEQRLKQFTSAVQVPADFFDIPRDFRRSEGPH